VPFCEGGRGEEGKSQNKRNKNDNEAKLTTTTTNRRRRDQEKRPFVSHPTQNGKWQSCHAQPNPCVSVCGIAWAKTHNNPFTTTDYYHYYYYDDFASAIKRQSFAIGSDLLGIEIISICTRTEV
jgi:hypothetical protein